MFESVLLPAPFSPSSACTSPAAASKSTRSFATTPGNDLEIPRIETAGEACSPAVVNPLALGAADHALDEPIHPVEVLHAQLLSPLDAQLALLVVQRPSELVELSGDQRLPLRRDRRLRLRRDLRAERCDADHPVLDRPVV